MTLPSRLIPDHLVHPTGDPRETDGYLLLREVEGRMGADPYLHTAVRQAVASTRALQRAGARHDPLELTAAIALVLAGRRLTDARPDVASALTYALTRVGADAVYRYRHPHEAGRQALELLDALGYEVRRKDGQDR